jgi:hypothetical protein
MISLRHRLQWGVAAWLIVQVAALSAFVPQDCCAAHKAQHQQARHHTMAVPDHSNHHSMSHESMHSGSHDPAPAVPAKGCVMKGTCKGPMSAIIAILSSHGVPPVSAFSIAPDLSSSLAAGIARQYATSHLASPETPPPRA